MKPGELINYVLPKLKHMTTLGQINALKGFLHEYIKDERYHGEYNNWAILNASEYLEKNIARQQKIEAENSTELAKPAFNASETLVSGLTEANEIDPVFIGQLLKIIKR